MHNSNHSHKHHSTHLQHLEINKNPPCSLRSLWGLNRAERLPCSRWCKWLLWCMIEWLLWFVEEKNTVSVINVCAKKGVCRKVTNPYAVVPLLEAGGNCGFWWFFIRKVWSVDHITIVMFIIECAIWGSAEKSRIHTQWSHFSRLAVTVDFDDISLEKYGQLII